MRGLRFFTTLQLEGDPGHPHNKRSAQNFIFGEKFLSVPQMIEVMMRFAVHTRAKSREDIFDKIVDLDQKRGSK